MSQCKIFPRSQKKYREEGERNQRENLCPLLHFSDEGETRV